jgi:hypothetical protein
MTVDALNVFLDELGRIEQTAAEALRYELRATEGIMRDASRRDPRPPTTAMHSRRPERAAA